MKIIYTIITLILLSSTLFSQQNELGIITTEFNKKDTPKLTEYDGRWEKKVIEIFNKYENISNIYELEISCPKIDVTIDYSEAQLVFLNEMSVWLEDNKRKYRKAYNYYNSQK